MNELTYDKFERYYKGLMNQDEASEFSTELQSNDELKSQFKDYKIAMLAIQESIAYDLRNQFKSLDQEASPANKSIRIIKMASKWAAIAAGIFILLVAGTAWYEVHVLDSMVDDQLFYAYTVETLRSDEQQNSDIATQLEKADFHYTQGEYDDAIALYRIIQQNNESDITRFIAAAEFHECMALYQLEGRHPSFDLLLNKIADDDAHLYSKKAKIFRDQLNKTLVKAIKG